MNRAVKIRQLRTPGTVGAELENHYILRLPKPQAGLLRDAIRQGHTNIKDRLSIQLDFTSDKDDMRNGLITFDTIMYKARLVDFPTIMETWKSIDGKNFYKTADVCQMLMVREGEDPPEEEDSKKKKRDPIKVDKKYLWPHGYTPPLKNIRKRRFRKTLRKKNLDLPEIEKEVKRLLRTDNEAANVKWEIIREEDEKKHNNDANLSASNLDEQLFGGGVSSSDDEVGATINIIDEDDDSRLSAESGHLSEYMNDAANSPNGKATTSVCGTPLITEFNPSMFHSDSDNLMGNIPKTPNTPTTSKSSPTSKGELYGTLAVLENEMSLLMSQRAAQEAETATIENLALKQRFLSKLADLETLIRDKESDIIDIRTQLQGI